MKNKTSEKEKEVLKLKYEKEILEVIVKKKIMRFNHIFGHYGGCSRPTAYNYGIYKLDSIREALEMNRVKGTDYLLQKWIAGDNPTLQIAAMRLICTPEEHRLLNQQYMENSGTITNKIELDNYTEEEKEQLLRLARKQSK